MDRDPSKSPEVLSANANGRGGGSFGYNRNSKTNAARSESKENMQHIAASSDAKRNDHQASTSLSRGTTNVHNVHSRPYALANTQRLSRPNSDVGVPVSYTPESSPRDSRIPRPMSAAAITSTTGQNSPGQPNRHARQSSALRQPMSLKSAFKLAQEQEAEDADGTIDLNHAFNMANAEVDRGIDASPSPAPRTYRSKRDPQDIASRGAPSSRRGSDLAQQLQRFDRNHQLGKGSGPLTGLFGKNRVGPAVNSASHTLAKKGSNSSLDSTPGRRGSGRWTGTPARNKENMNPTRSTTPNSGSLTSDPGDHGAPIPSIELKSPTSDERPSFLPRSFNPSPEKSFNWHLDADFTAGDLQISDSPRIYTARTNAGYPQSVPSGSPEDNDTPRFQRSNNKLEQIREREARVESIPIRDDSLSPNSRKNTKLDEIRAREKEALSKRAVATSRLDEIKARNSEARSESPEAGRRSSRSSLGSDSWSSSYKHKDNIEQPLAVQNKEAKNEFLSNAIDNNQSDVKRSDPTKAQDDNPRQEVKAKEKLSSHDGSHDLLRRLARATSSPPPVALAETAEAHVSTKEISGNPESDEKEGTRPRLTREEGRSRNLESKSSRERPTVGFVGLKRVASSDSLRSKRGSKSGSEADPTDRIQAEMNLFAPQDNYSERGSVRAPSPLPSDKIEEETPRATKIDPTTLPTPRVTGAYVETPATIRVKDEDGMSDKTASDSVLHTSRPLRRAHGIDSKSTAQTTQRRGSDASTSAAESQARSASAPAVRRKPICKRQRRPLINTAKPPSVKDDIRAILRRHEIDDSTLEDFDERLAKHEIDPEELEQMVEDSALKVEEQVDNPELADNEHGLGASGRMVQSLKTLLTDIRTAKHGIERLEDKVTHAKHKPQIPADPVKPIPESQVAADSEKSSLKTPPSSGTATVLVALPALWRREPKFKLTPLGLLSVFLAIWWPLELAFSHCYATPQYCIPSVPCDWSPNEPYYPYTMPFMIDEWVTGGKGRAWALWIGEEMGDYMADISDWITNTDFTQHDQRFMDVWERKRHRRRLQKHGLIPQWAEPPEFRPIYAQWEAERRAREEAEELGYDLENDESMSADERVRW